MVHTSRLSLLTAEIGGAVTVRHFACIAGRATQCFKQRTPLRGRTLFSHSIVDLIHGHRATFGMPASHFSMIVPVDVSHVPRFMISRGSSVVVI